MASLHYSTYPEIKKLYEGGATMSIIARQFNVSLNAVTYAMRKAKIPRRSQQNARILSFTQKAPSFTIRELRTESELTIATLGLSLYWAEGYKTEKASGIDFANSDQSMIMAFMKFLRTCYRLDESRFRILLYCHADQNISKLTHHWSMVTKIPKSQFSKPYIRQDIRKDGRKMQNGLIHVRYADKKLLCDILERIKRLRETI